MSNLDENGGSACYLLNGIVDSVQTLYNFLLWLNEGLNRFGDLDIIFKVTIGILISCKNQPF